MGRAADAAVQTLAKRLTERRLYKTLDLAAVSEDEGRQALTARKIDKAIADGRLSGAVIKDEQAKVSLYTQIGGDDDRMHKKLHIMDGEKPTEISKLSPIAARPCYP